MSESSEKTLNGNFFMMSEQRATERLLPASTMQPWDAMALG